LGELIMKRKKPFTSSILDRKQVSPKKNKTK
jgi:hypothetical protein